MLVRRHLAACYRMFAQRGMDDLIYTHLSARLPGSSGRFLFIPFGMLFDEVTASNLLEVDIAGNDVSGSGVAVIRRAGSCTGRCTKRFQRRSA